MCALSLLFPPEHTWEGKLSVFSNKVCLRRSVWSYSPPGLCWKVAEKQFSQELEALGPGSLPCIMGMSGPSALSKSRYITAPVPPCLNQTEPDSLPSIQGPTGPEVPMGWRERPRAVSPRIGEAVHCLVLTPPSMPAGNLWLAPLFHKCIVCMGAKCSFSHHKYNFSLPLVLWHKISMIWWFSVQLLNCVWLFWTPRTTACQPSLSITNSQRLLNLMSIELVMPSKHFFLCHPLLLLSSSFPSIRVFSKESVLHVRWPNYWNFSFSIIPSSEYSGLISFSIDWFDLLAVEGTLKNLLQHHSSPSILWCSTFFMVQLSHLYMATRKAIASRGPGKNICKDLSPFLGCQK